jgi:hypothetical protein
MWFLRFGWSDDAGREWAALPSTRVFRSEDGLEGCAYVDDGPAGSIADITRGLAASSGPEHDSPLVKLDCLQVIRGAAWGSDAPWHYIVATDVLPAHEEDFLAWYGQEHLPGLAAVPGAAHAARYRVIKGDGPRHHACYDLADRAAFNSPAWLAVRATPWSARVRPAFFNTRRTMYRRIAAPPPAFPALPETTA